MRKDAKFNRDRVIDMATNLYWEKGFHGTSMRDLQAAIDMRPGSIYAAFGSKDALFKAALTHYTDLGIAQLAQCYEQSSSPIEAIKAFVKQLVGKQTDAPSRICMLVKTVAELTDEQAELLQAAQANLKKIEHELALLFDEAQKIGEIGHEQSAQELARFTQIQISGMRSYARTYNDTLPLDTMLDTLFSHYPYR